MSRRKLYWKNKVWKAGSLESVLPKKSKGNGTYLTKVSIPEKTSGITSSRDHMICTLPMSPRKEELIRRWAR